MTRQETDIAASSTTSELHAPLPSLNSVAGYTPKEIVEPLRTKYKDEMRGLPHDNPHYLECKAKSEELARFATRLEKALNERVFASNSQIQFFEDSLEAAAEQIRKSPGPQQSDEKIVMRNNTARDWANYLNNCR